MAEWDEIIAENRRNGEAQFARLPAIAKRIKPEDRRLSGIGCGWEPLLLRLDEELSRLDPDYAILKFKEKFGELCVHASPADRSVYGEFYAVIKKYAEESKTVCEVCGKAGRMSGGPWIRTLCNEHWVETSPRQHFARAREILEALRRKQQNDGK